MITALSSTVSTLTGDTSDEDWSKPKQLNTTRKRHSPEFDDDCSGMENVNRHAAPLAASFDHWQFGELELFPHTISDLGSSSSNTPYETGTAVYWNTTDDRTGDTSDEDWSMENVDGLAAPPAASLDHWQFGELEIFPHL